MQIILGLSPSRTSNILDVVLLPSKYNPSFLMSRMPNRKSVFALGLMRGYWVLITVCVLLLRPHILVTFSFTAMLIIGTIGGVVIGSIIVTNVHSIWLLVFIYAVKNVIYALAAFFLTPFILVFLNVLIPSQTLLAQTRILDTIIGAGLSLLGVFIIWAFSYLKR